MLTPERKQEIILAKRRGLLNYLMAKDIERYRAILAKLGLRK